MSHARRRTPPPPTDRPCVADCGYPAFNNYFLCTGCGDDLWHKLTKVCQPQRDAANRPGTTLVDELKITIAGLDRLSDNNIGVAVRSAEQPIPWNEKKERASKALDDLYYVLRTWASTIAGCHSIAYELWTNPVEAADFLLRHHNRVRKTDIAGQAYRQILDAVQQAEWAVDRPPQRLFAGMCGAEVEGEEDCTQYLYADEGQERIRCRACGSEWFVDERRKWLVLVAETEKALTATVMAGLFAAAGVRVAGKPVTAAQIRSYASRGRIKAHDVDDLNHPRYLIDDVRRALFERYQHRQAV